MVDSQRKVLPFPPLVEAGAELAAGQVLCRRGGPFFPISDAHPHSDGSHLLSRFFARVSEATLSGGAMVLPSRPPLMLIIPMQRVKLPSEPDHDWFTPCDSIEDLPDLSLGLDANTNWTLRPQQYVMARTSSGFCKLPFRVFDSKVGAIGRELARPSLLVRC
jgi:hypothetical protein